MARRKVPIPPTPPMAHSQPGSVRPISTNSPHRSAAPTGNATIKSPIGVMIAPWQAE